MLARAALGLRFNEHIEEDGAIVSSVTRAVRRGRNELRDGRKPRRTGAGEPKRDIGVGVMRHRLREGRGLHGLLAVGHMPSV